MFCSMEPPGDMEADGNWYTNEKGKAVRGVCLDFALLLRFTNKDGIQVIGGGLIFSQSVEYKAQQTNVKAWASTLSKICGSNLAQPMQ